MPVGDQVVLSGEPRVCGVLIEGVDPSVSDCHTLQVHPGIVVELQVACNVRNVVAGVALTSYVEGSMLVLRVLVHEVVEEGGEVGRDGML